MARLKVSFICTVFNEEKTITKLLRSLVQQTLLPDEIIICDGGSTDTTISVMTNFKYPISKEKIKILSKKGNRSIGRNEAIRQAAGDIIVCTDAGCILDQYWVEKIVRPFQDTTVDVVAGYYKSKATTLFQKCLIPYAFVMPDRLDPNKFLPATRSMALRKKVWQKVGKFNEHYSHNEDYEFARRLKKLRAKIVFARDAVVYWIPRNDIRAAFTMFFRFAFGDAEAGILRPKVALLFARYVILLFLIIGAGLNKNANLFLVVCSLILIYIIWSIAKNYRYVQDIRAYVFLPLLQIISDFAVLTGTTLGIIHRWATQDKR